MRWWARSNPKFLASSAAGRNPADGGWPRFSARPCSAACSGVQQSLSSFSNPFGSQPGPAGPPQQPLAVGNGQVKVGLILPLSAAGNAGVAAQSMKNAAEMALAEFQNPNIQLLIKDDAGSPQGAQQANPAGPRRRRRDHSGSAVRAVGSGDGAADPRRAASR